MTVDVVVSTPGFAVAHVDGVRVRVGFNHARTRVTWRCDQCGNDSTPSCPHARAFADTPVPTKGPPR